MNNEITIDIEKIRQLPDGSVNDCETIRQIALTRDKELSRKINPKFAYAGLYPEVMNLNNILPKKKNISSFK